jgi:hypothetical protein
MDAAFDAKHCHHEAREGHEGFAYLDCKLRDLRGLLGEVSSSFALAALGRS